VESSVRERGESTEVDEDLADMLQEQSLEDMLLFLIENGLPYDAVYGFHDGWDFERLYRAFLYFKTRETENLRSAAHAAVIGASVMGSTKGWESFMKKTGEVLSGIKGERFDGDERWTRHEKQKKAADLTRQFQKLAGLVVGKQKGKQL